MAIERRDRTVENPGRTLGRMMRKAFGGFLVSLAYPDLMSAYGSGYQYGRSLGNTQINYQQFIGDGRGSSILMSVVFWLMRTFPEAPVQVSQWTSSGKSKVVVGHPLTKLLRRPNEAYGGVLLWQATIADWLLTGNSYWWKLRYTDGRVAQLWWIPSYLINPQPHPYDTGIYIDHYAYKPDPNMSNPLRLDPADIVHFRYGLDPYNIRRGLSPIGSLFREIFTDEEGANFTAQILKNLGVPGVIISPDSGDIDIPQPEAERIKAEFINRFGADNRGAPLVISAKVKTQVLSFTPEQLNLKMLRRIPEERVSAIFGIPAVVVGLGAGLDRSTFANFSEAREAAYESNVIPTQRLFAEELSTQLLDDFADTDKFFVEFDISKVRVLQTDVNELYNRAATGVKGVYMTMNEARTSVGLEVLPDGDVFLVPNTSTLVHVDDLADPPVPKAPAKPGGPPPADAGAGTDNAASGGSEPPSTTAPTIPKPKPATNGHTGTTPPPRRGRSGVAV